MVLGSKLSAGLMGMEERIIGDSLFLFLFPKLL